MTSWIWVSLRRLSGEESLVFYVFFGAATFAGMTFLGKSGLSFLPGLGGLSFIAGIVALPMLSLYSGLSFVAFTVAPQPLYAAPVVAAATQETPEQGPNFPPPPPLDPRIQ